MKKAQEALAAAREKVLSQLPRAKRVATPAGSGEAPPAKRQKSIIDGNDDETDLDMQLEKLDIEAEEREANEAAAKEVAAREVEVVATAQKEQEKGANEVAEKTRAGQEAEELREKEVEKMQQDNPERTEAAASRPKAAAEDAEHNLREGGKEVGDEGEESNLDAQLERLGIGEEGHKAKDAITEKKAGERKTKEALGRRVGVVGKSGATEVAESGAKGAAVASRQEEQEERQISEDASEKGREGSVEELKTEGMEPGGLDRVSQEVSSPEIMRVTSISARIMLGLIQEESQGLVKAQLHQPGGGIVEEELIGMGIYDTNDREDNLDVKGVSSTEHQVAQASNTTDDKATEKESGAKEQTNTEKGPGGDGDKKRVAEMLKRRE